MEKKIRKRYHSEEAVKKALKIESFRNLTKDKVMEFTSMIPYMEKEVALEIIKQFPVYVEFVESAIENYTQLCKTILETNKEEYEQAVHAHQYVLETFANQLEQENLTEEERREFSEKMMAKNADMVMFNRCRPEDPLPSFRRSIKVVNQACDVLFENEEGEIDNIFEDQMPFDTDADVIEIDDADYGIWYVDMGDNPERYEGKTVHFRGMVLKSKDVGADFFVPGRMAMTCCADDTSFIGYVCKCASAKSLVMGSWVDVTATVKWGYMKVYDGEGPVLYAKEIKPAKKPESELVYFN